MPSTCPRSNVRPRRLAPYPPGHSTSVDGAGLVIEGTDASIRDVIAASAQHPVVMVLWSPRLQESADFVSTLGAVARRYAGRFQLVTVDVDANPTIMQAFQVQAVPVSFAFVQSQPVPLFEGVQPEAQVTAVIDQVLALAAQHGVTGTVAGGEPACGSARRLPRSRRCRPCTRRPMTPSRPMTSTRRPPPTARRSLQAPADTDAKIGLAQVGLMQRTRGSRPPVRPRRGGAAPTDVDAQILVADLDLLGGHVEDAFLRLVDTVRITVDADRDRAREHLVELFDVVGVTDERVVRARKSLMSALF